MLNKIVSLYDHPGIAWPLLPIVKEKLTKLVIAKSQISKGEIFIPHLELIVGHILAKSLENVPKWDKNGAENVPKTLQSTKI